MQRIDSGSCKVVGAGVLVAGKQIAQAFGRQLLAGGRPRQMQARIEDRAVGAEPFHGQRAGLLLLREGGQRVGQLPARRCRQRPPRR